VSPFTTVCELLPVDFFAVLLDFVELDLGLLLLVTVFFGVLVLLLLVVLRVGVLVGALKAYGSASTGATGCS
jgi:hypothetical protein